METAHVAPERSVTILNNLTNHVETIVRYTYLSLACPVLSSRSGTACVSILSIERRLHCRSYVVSELWRLPQPDRPPKPSLERAAGRLNLSALVGPGGLENTPIRLTHSKSNNNLQYKDRD